MCREEVLCACRFSAGQERGADHCASGIAAGDVTSTDLAAGLLAAEVAITAWSLTSSSSTLSLLRIFAPFCASSQALQYANRSAGVAECTEASQRLNTLSNSSMLFSYAL